VLLLYPKDIDPSLEGEGPRMSVTALSNGYRGRNPRHYDGKRRAVQQGASRAAGAHRSGGGGVTRPPPSALANTQLQPQIITR
jgi:hypothetical protein